MKAATVINARGYTVCTLMRTHRQTPKRVVAGVDRASRHLRSLYMGHFISAHTHLPRIIGDSKEMTMEVVLVLGTYLMIFVGGFIGGMVTMAIIMLHHLKNETDRQIKGIGKLMEETGESWKGKSSCSWECLTHNARVCQHKCNCH